MEEIFINVIADTHFTNTIPQSRKDNYPETIRQKYRSIFELYPCHYNIFAGDVFHKSVLPLKYINSMAELEVETRKIDGHQTYVVPGNHDASFADLSYLNQSALGNWIETQLVKKLDRLTISIGSVEVDILGWDYSEKLPKKRDNVYTIMIGHAFYENSVVKEKELVITASEIREEGYDMVVLGHDHAKYLPCTIPGTNCILYRPGGFSRGTSNHYNVWKEIAILRIALACINGKFVVNADYVTVPSLSPEEVFLEEARNKRQTEFKKTLQDFVLKVRGTTLQSGEVYEVLDSLEIETDVKRYVENLLTSYGIVRI